MVKYNLILVVLLLQLSLYSQKTFERKGIVKLATTLSPVWVKGNSGANAFLSSHLEYFPEEKMSFKGENNIYLGSPRAVLKEYRTMLHTSFGGLYHFTKSRSDLYMGIHPGLMLFSEKEPISKELTQDLELSPTLSVSLGYTFFLSNFFHFFADLKNTQTSAYNKGYTHFNMWTFSAGLSFGFQTSRRK